MTMNEIFNLTKECLEKWSQDPQAKNRAAFTFIDGNNSQTWSYEELWDILNIYATNLNKIVKSSNSKILIRMPHSAEYAFCFFASILADKIPIPASPELSNQEINFLLKDSEAREIITLETKNTYKGDYNLISPEQLNSSIAKNKFYASKATADKPAFMVYTSGTTSKPKGVLHAHRTILGRKLMKEGWEHYQPDDNVLHAGTLNWTFTLGVGLMDVWLAGGHSHLYNGSKEPKKWIEMIEKYQISIFVGVPTIYRQILKYVEISKKSLSSLRYGLCSGEPLPKEVLKGWQSTVGTDLYEALGMTELSTYISTHKKIEIKPGSPGKPQPGRNIVILPEENGTTPLQANEVGLLASHKSDPGLMLGYWKRPEEEKEVFRGDWFIGGDTASIDEDGYIWFHGRSDEIIKSFGYRVSPVEVEAALDGLDNVNESAVFGMQAHENKTLICAVVVLNSNSKFVEEDIKLTLAETLANYKMPHVIYPIKKIPRTRNGKIKRSQLKKEYANNID